MNAHDCRALVLWYAARAHKDKEVRRVTFAMCKQTTMPDDKANRWLGYMQGWLSAQRIYTVDELRTHIRERVWE